MPLWYDCFVCNCFFSIVNFGRKSAASALWPRGPDVKFLICHQAVLIFSADKLDRKTFLPSTLYFDGLQFATASTKRPSPGFLHCFSDLVQWRLHLLCPGFNVVQFGYRGLALMQIRATAALMMVNNPVTVLLSRSMFCALNVRWVLNQLVLDGNV